MSFPDCRLAAMRVIHHARIFRTIPQTLEGTEGDMMCAVSLCATAAYMCLLGQSFGVCVSLFLCVVN